MTSGWNYHALGIPSPIEDYTNVFMILLSVTFMFLLAFSLKCLIYLEFSFVVWSKVYKVRIIVSTLHSHND